MGKKAAISVLLVLVLSMAGMGPSGAHVSPPGCNTTDRFFTIATPDKTVVRPGDTLSFTVVVDNLNNPGSVACEVTNATVTWTKPALNGTETGPTEVIASNASYPGNSRTTVGVFSLTVAVNAGVSELATGFDVLGKLHESTGDPLVNSSSHPRIEVTQPAINLTKSASPTSGRAPLTVTYTYQEHNVSTTNAPISNVALADNQCSPITLTGGDTNGNNLLDVAEIWTFTCTKTFTSPGTFVSDVRATGINGVDQRPAPPAMAQATVTVRDPHITLTVTPSVTSGTVPLAVTYTYRERNDGTDPISNVAITDSNCSPITRTGGDDNGNNRLDVGETWVFTCSRTFTEVGTYRSEVRGTGVDVVDGQPAPLETAEVTVTASVPPPTMGGAENVDPGGGGPSGRAGSGGSSLPRTGLGAALLGGMSLASISFGSLLVGVSAERGSHIRRRWRRRRPQHRRSGRLRRLSTKIALGPLTRLSMASVLLGALLLSSRGGRHSKR